MIRTSYKHLKEQLNLFVYDSQPKVAAFFKLIMPLTAFASFGILLYYYGFGTQFSQGEILLKLVRYAFLVFFLNYLSRLFYSADKWLFFKRHLFEGVLMIVAMVEGLSSIFINFPLFKNILATSGYGQFEKGYLISMHIYMLVLVSLELLKYGQKALSLKIKPGLLFTASFLILVLAGTGLLMLPEMTTSKQSMGVLNALFTSTSATCVTGLIVEDTATFFSLKGKVIILLLIQLGGLGILSFASFFAIFVKRGMGIRQQTALQDMLSTENLFNARELLGQIVLYTFTIELIGAVLIYATWSPEVQFNSWGQKAFYSVFHSISAFCNAGFALFTNGLMEKGVATSYMQHVVIMILIVLGGIGFPVLRDLTSISRLRERMRKPWMKWKMSTSIAIYASLLLIFGGGLIFYFLEKENTLAGLMPLEAVITALFQSVTARTAGFNTVDMSAMTNATYVMFIFLMFVGASSGGTGGGIKTSTFFVMLLAGYSTIRGKKVLHFRGKTIPQDLLNKAYSLLIFGATWILFTVFCLSISETGKDIMFIVFETVSAFGTVGVSAGLTASLTPFGKVMIIITMFIGRIGLLTLAFALSSPVVSNNYKYPNTHMMIG
jgi:potassium uptake TrkH family protein